MNNGMPRTLQGKTPLLERKDWLLLVERYIMNKLTL